MKLLEFFEESNGNLSNTRLLSSLCVFTALFITVTNVIHGLPVPTDTMVVLLGAGFGGKIIQKPFEEKQNGTAPPVTP